MFLFVFDLDSKEFVDTQQRFRFHDRDVNCFASDTEHIYALTDQLIQIDPVTYDKKELKMKPRWLDSFAGTVVVCE